MITIYNCSEIRRNCKISSTKKLFQSLPKISFSAQLIAYSLFIHNFTQTPTGSHTREEHLCLNFQLQEKYPLKLATNFVNCDTPLDAVLLSRFEYALWLNVGLQGGQKLFLKSAQNDDTLGDSPNLN